MQIACGLTSEDHAYHGLNPLAQSVWMEQDRLDSTVHFCVSECGALDVGGPKVTCRF